MLRQASFRLHPLSFGFLETVCLSLSSPGYIELTILYLLIVFSRISSISISCKKGIEKQESGSCACPGVGPWLNLHGRKINTGRRRGDHNPSCVLIPRLSNFLKRQAIKTLEETKWKVMDSLQWEGGEFQLIWHVICLLDVK